MTREGRRYLGRSRSRRRRGPQRRRCGRSGAWLARTPYGTEAATPFLDRVDDRPEAPALRRELVVDARGYFGVNGPREQSEPLELAQSHREHLRRRGGNEPLQITKPLGAVHQVVKDDQRPLCSHDGKRLLDRAVLRRGGRP